MSNKPPRKPKNLDRRSREYLTPSEVKKVVKAAGSVGRNRLRDKLLILVGYRHALRVGELVNLRWDQFDFEAKTIYVNRLKNGNPATHFLESDELEDLKKLRRSQTPTNYVFTTKEGNPLSSRTAHTIISRAGERANLDLTIHPHMLRHGKGHQLARRGVDTRAIQEYFGHTNINSTIVYTFVTPDRFKDFGKRDLA